MKRNTLTTAVLAGLTGVAGMVSVSNAINVNPDGLGQVLLYPYYTTRGGNDTLISIVNTTDRGKAVKIRFIEALNSREVLDFNIYMSAWDIWTAAITDEGPGAKMITSDTTCTSPYFLGEAGGPGSVAEVPFVDLAYNQPELTDDGGPTSLDRTRSGYIEVLEMGVLGVDDVNSEDVEAAAEHRVSGPDRGTPPPSGTTGSNAQIPCGLFQERWIPAVFDNGNGIWDNEGDPGPSGVLDDSRRGMEDPIGGLFGNAAIVDVESGTMLSYEATALDNFWAADQIFHSIPRSTEPGLGSTNNTESNVFISGGAEVENSVWFDSIDAVNHALAVNTLMNEYNINPGLGASTEWVVTFPTKRQHVDAARGGFPLTEVIPPFSQLWTNDSPTSCDLAPLSVWDREEQLLTFQAEGDTCPSPRPIDPETGLEIPCQGGPQGNLIALCREANVVRFGPAEEAAPPAESEILGEPSAAESMRPQYGYINQPLPSRWIEGWGRIGFNGFTGRADTDGRVFTGLPAIGFWANTFTNDAVTEGVLANYGGAYRHRGSRVPLETP
jgi:hypothetical protein